MPIGNNAEMLLKYDMIMITSVNNSSYTVTGCLQSFTYRKNIFSFPKMPFISSWYNCKEGCSYQPLSYVKLYVFKSNHSIIVGKSIPSTINIQEA